MNSHLVYMRLRHRVQATKQQNIKIGDIAQIVAKKEIRDKIGRIPVHEVDKDDGKLIVIDIMKVITQVQEQLQEQLPEIELQSIGAAQTIIEVYDQPKFKPLFFCVVWLLLFIGAGLAIMNFHEDVSMQAVHQKLYEIITGEQKEKPYILQIPYSIGLGLGMILFFNHFFQKRINEEPSPLEVEMFKYQEAVDHYVSVHENKESETKIHGH